MSYVLINKSNDPIISGSALPSPKYTFGVWTKHGEIRVPVFESALIPHNFEHEVHAISLSEFMSNPLILK